MAQLTRTQFLQNFSSILEELYSFTPGAHFPQHLFKAISRYVPGAKLSFDKLSNATGDYELNVNFEIPNRQDWLSRVGRNVEKDHPAIPLVREAQIKGLFSLNDFLTQRELRRTDLYNETLLPMETAYQLSVLVPIPGFVAGLTVNRDQYFSADETLLISMLAPHIERSHANALGLEEKRRGTLNTSFGEVPRLRRGLGLTGREEEVLPWLALGKTDMELALILGISHKTVGKHVEHILEKLGVETRSGVVNLAAAGALFEPFAPADNKGANL